MPRDVRLVAVHRGGTLSIEDHRLLVQWSADCAARVLSYFSARRPDDPRPEEAIATARCWASGECTTGAAREAAIRAHAAAREVDGAARAAARACGHAAATAHMADHELGAAYYALQAVDLAGAPRVQWNAEREWQRQAIPEPVSQLIRSDMVNRAAKFQGVFN